MVAAVAVVGGVAGTGAGAATGNRDMKRSSTRAVFVVPG